MALKFMRIWQLSNRHSTVLYVHYTLCSSVHEFSQNISPQNPPFFAFLRLNFYSLNLPYVLCAIRSPLSRSSYYMRAQRHHFTIFLELPIVDVLCTHRYIERFNERQLSLSIKFNDDATERLIWLIDLVLCHWEMVDYNYNQ